MIQQAQREITELNNLYLNGQIPYDDYKNKRGVLLNALFEEITVRSTSSTPPPAAPTEVTASATSSTNKRYYAAMVILIIGIAMAITFILPDDETDSAPVVVKSNIESTPAATTKQAEEVTQSTAQKLEAIINESLNNNSWTTDKLYQIEFLWEDMSSEEITMARQSHWYPKLTDALNNLVSEQKALVDLGNQDAAELEEQIHRLIATLNRK